MNKILIIKPSGIGDIVHSLPVAYGLKFLITNCQIYWLVFSRFANILHNIRPVDKLILWDRFGGVREYIKVIKAIRAEKFDLVVDLQALLRTAIISYLSNSKIRLAVSLSREFSWLFEKPIEKFNPKEHAVERNYRIVKYLLNQQMKSKSYQANISFQLPQPTSFLPWIHITDEEKEIAKKLLLSSGLDIDKSLVLFAVTSRGEHKIWPYYNFIELINLTAEQYDILPVFLGMKGEEGIVKKVTDGLKCKFIDLTGRTDLRLASSIISLCKLVIGNDSALIHIAAALNIPVVGLYGPTDPSQLGPYSNKSTAIYKKLPCSPCNIKTSCKNYRCMNEITPEEVFNVIKNFF